MLSQAATVLNGKLLGADVLFTAVSKDTRSIAQGDLYVALKGERFDGHAFVTQAGEAGAVGALVSEQQASSMPQVHVADTRLALGELAASWRQGFKGRLVGITGSNGKTTVKEMCRSILVQAAGEAKVLSTQGNLNNDIGMPMTLLSIRDVHVYAVIEMGANHVGEINYLSNIAQPDIAVITNAGPAHLEGFGTVEKVAQAKAEIYGGLKAQGTAVINLDDAYAAYWLKACAGKNIKTFSMRDDSADVHATVTGDDGFVLNCSTGKAQIKLPVPGQHNVMNALAAATVALALDVKLEQVVAGLENFAGVAGRLAIKYTANGNCIIDDSYNANPLSVKAAIDVLIKIKGDAWLVLGDMGELGPESEQLHADVGRQAKQLGVKRLFAVGRTSRKAVESFGAGAAFFTDQQSLIDAIENQMDNHTVVLVKGSRAMAMDKVVDALVSKNDAGNKNNNRPGVN